MKRQHDKNHSLKKQLETLSIKFHGSAPVESSVQDTNVAKEFIKRQLNQSEQSQTVKVVKISNNQSK